MSKKDEQVKIVIYVLIAFVAGAALMYFLTAAPSARWGFGMMGPGMMWGQQGSGMMQYMQSYRDTVNADCSVVTAEQLEKIGDEIMGQMIGDEKIHERIDETHPNIDAMHLMMGRIATGCY